MRIQSPIAFRWPIRRDLGNMPSSRTNVGIRVNEYPNHAELIVVDSILRRPDATILVDEAEKYRTSGEIGQLYDVKRRDLIPKKLERREDGTVTPLTEEELGFFQNFQPRIDIRQDQSPNNGENIQDTAPGRVYIIRPESLYLHTSQGMFKANLRKPRDEDVLHVYSKEVCRDIQRGLRDVNVLSPRHKRNTVAKLEAEAIEKYSGEIVLLKAYSEGNSGFVDGFYKVIRQLTRRSHPSA